MILSFCFFFLSCNKNKNVDTKVNYALLMNQIESGVFLQLKLYVYQDQNIVLVFCRAWSGVEVAVFGDLEHLLESLEKFRKGGCNSNLTGLEVCCWLGWYEFEIRMIPFLVNWSPWNLSSIWFGSLLHFSIFRHYLAYRLVSSNVGTWKNWALPLLSTFEMSTMLSRDFGKEISPLSIMHFLKI